jgi:general transcription factor IIIA
VKGSHSQERKYTCEYPGCGAAFLTGTRLRRHAAVHDGADRFRCRGFEGCEKSFRKHGTLQRHIRTEHLNQKAFPCNNNGCEEAFDNSGALRRHLEREHGSIQYWCGECANGSNADEDHSGIGFTTLALLQAHIRLEHISCMFCDVKCGSQAELESHIEECHTTVSAAKRQPASKPRVECTRAGCTSTFASKSNLNVHIRTQHEGLRFVCGQVDLQASKGIEGWGPADACGKAFISKLKLEEHVRRSHLMMELPSSIPTMAIQHGEPDSMIDRLSGTAQSTKKALACQVADCNETFARHHDLNVHLAWHAQAVGSPMALDDPLGVGSEDVDMDTGAVFAPADEWALLRPLMGSGDNYESCEEPLDVFIDPVLYAE